MFQYHCQVLVLFWYYFGNKVKKGESLLQENKAHQVFGKTHFLPPDTHTLNWYAHVKLSLFYFVSYFLVSALLLYCGRLARSIIDNQFEWSLEFSRNLWDIKNFDWFQVDLRKHVCHIRQITRNIGNSFWKSIKHISASFNDVI